MKITSASMYSNPVRKTSFGALTPVSYVVIDGHSYKEKSMIEQVIKDFVKQIRYGRKEDAALRRQLYDATGDSSLACAYQCIKRLGKHIITGQDAINLENIWSLKDVSLNDKKKLAADYVRNLFAKRSRKKITLHAEKINVKNKDRYVIKNLYTTLF